MTVKHIAFLRFKDGVSSERIEGHMAACRELAGVIPAVIDVECGANFTDRAGGLTHCIIVTLPNRDGLSAYLGNPAHVSVAAALQADVADMQVMDAEVSS